MAEQVTLPGVGPVDKKWLYVGGALVVGIVGYAWWQRSTQAAPVVDDGLAQGAPVDEYTNPRPVQSVIDTTNPDEIRTNTQWTASVTEKLGNLGYDSTYLGTILGKYLGRQPLNVEEQAVIRTAWAYAGKPPEGPDNFTTGGGSGGGNEIPTEATVSEGWHVDVWIGNINGQYPGLNLTKSALRTMNPNVRILKANSRGYVSPTNPANGSEIDVFNGNQTVRIR